MVYQPVIPQQELRDLVEDTYSRDILGSLAWPYFFGINFDGHGRNSLISKIENRIDSRFGDVLRHYPDDRYKLTVVKERAYQAANELIDLAAEYKEEAGKAVSRERRLLGKIAGGGFVASYLGSEAFFNSWEVTKSVFQYLTQRQQVGEDSLLLLPMTGVLVLMSTFVVTLLGLSFTDDLYKRPVRREFDKRGRQIKNSIYQSFYE